MFGEFLKIFSWEAFLIKFYIGGRRSLTSVSLRRMNEAAYHYIVGIC